MSKESFFMLRTVKGRRKNMYNNNKIRKGKYQISISDITRFHKLDNLCVLEDINVKVTFKNCISRNISSKFCYGTCSSIYIPQMRPKNKKALFQSISSCVPTNYDIIKIRLECPGQSPDFIYREIVKITSCSCQNISP
uniref:Bursicon n=1 Tax=Parastrongyloides trichosuri TaxID=131310 RepID=A0A0N4ZPY1_PARTI